MIVHMRLRAQVREAMLTTPSRSRGQTGFSRQHRGLHLAFILVFSVLCFLPNKPFSQIGLGIAAVVNDEAISVLDLNSRVAMVLESSQIPNTPQAQNRVTYQVLRNLIDESLKLQAASQAGIDVLETRIDDAVAEISRRNKLSPEALSDHFISIGSHISSLRTKLEAQLAWNLYVQRKLSRKITISDDEVNDEIKRIQNSAGKPEYLLAEIFLPVDASTPDAEVREMSQRLLMHLKVIFR